MTQNTVEQQANYELRSGRSLRDFLIRRLWPTRRRVSQSFTRPWSRASYSRAAAINGSKFPGPWRAPRSSARRCGPLKGHGRADYLSLRHSKVHVEMAYVALVILVALSASPSFGQYVSVIQTCSRDVAQFCATDQRGGSPLTECVKTHFDNFSEPCKAALVRIAVVREACGADIHEHCPAVKPGAGRILLCVKQHFAAMSEPCKEAISLAAERKAGVH